MAYCPRAIDIDDIDFEGRTFWQQRGFSIGSPKTGTRCRCASAEDLTEERRDEIRSYFQQRADGDRHIINKNPHLSNKIGLLHAIFPSARIIHIVREELSVVASTKRGFDDMFDGRNHCRVPFLAYWPEEPELPCWYTVPAGYSAPTKLPLKRRLKALVKRSRRVPPPRHEDPSAFRREFPDSSRYYPEEGFRRIPESWLRINANVIRQMDALAITERCLSINYADLVRNTRDTLSRVARFCQLDVSEADAVPQTLDATRQYKWQTDLTTAEQLAAAEVTEELHVEASLICDRLPGPLVMNRRVATT